MIAHACEARGYVTDRFRIRIAEHPVHVVEAGAGGTAIEAAYRLMQELRRLEEDSNTRKRLIPLIPVSLHLVLCSALEAATQSKWEI